MVIGRKRNRWTSDEDQALKKAVQAMGKTKPSWAKVAKHIPGRTSKDCRKRWAHGLNQNLSRGCWSSSEDARLKSAVEVHGPHWALVATKVGGRTSDQCAKRWSDVLDPTLNKSEWTPQEDQTLLDLYQQLGTAWAKVATHIPGRSALHCRNRACKLLVDRREPRPGSIEAEELRLSRLAEQHQANSSAAAPALQTNQFVSVDPVPSPSQMNAQTRVKQLANSDKGIGSAGSLPSLPPPSEGVEHVDCDLSSWLDDNAFHTSLDSFLSYAASSEPNTAVKDSLLDDSKISGSSKLDDLLLQTAATTASTAELAPPFEFEPLLEPAIDGNVSKTPAARQVESMDQPLGRDTNELSSSTTDSVSSWDSDAGLTSSTTSTSPWSQLFSPADCGGITSAGEWLSSVVLDASSTDIHTINEEARSPKKIDGMHKALFPQPTASASTAAAKRMSMPALGHILTMADDPARVLRMLDTKWDADQPCRRRKSTGVNYDFSGNALACSDVGSLTATSCDFNSTTNSNTNTSWGSYTALERSSLPHRLNNLPAVAGTITSSVGTNQLATTEATYQKMQYLQQQRSNTDVAIPQLSSLTGDNLGLNSSQDHSPSNVEQLSHLVRNMVDLMASMATLARAISSGNTSSHGI